MNLKFLLQFGLQDVTDRYNSGQISYVLYKKYCSVWDWSAPRWTGRAGMKQESFWGKYGKNAYYKRINKIRRAFGFTEIEF